MELLTGLLQNAWGVAKFALPFLFVLTVVVFFHELGHFLVARWCKVKVTAFSIGFGPEIVGINDRHGTRWRLAWIPLGGYVKFMDDQNAASQPVSGAVAKMTEEERKGSFHAKPVWQRAAVVAAGPVANFILAIVIYWLVFSLYGLTTMEPRVGSIRPDSPAAAAGFQPGDLVVSIDGRKIEDFGELQQIVSTNPGRLLVFEVERSGQILTLQAVPKLHEVEDKLNGKSTRAVIGIQASAQASKITHRQVGVGEAFALSVQRTQDVITGTLRYVGDVLIGRQQADQLGGPIRIAEVSGKVAKLAGLDGLLNLIAVLSVSVGLLNLFPIPLLDGGHLMFYAFEALLGRPLSERTQEIGFRIGMALVLSLMVFATWNDRSILLKWITGAS